MHSPNNCGLCNSTRESYRITFENEHAVSVVIYNPVNATHQMIVPRRHIIELKDISQAEAKSIFSLQYTVQQRLFELYNKHPPVIAIQTGKLSTIPHIHWQAFCSDAHIRLLYARSHEPSQNDICAKAIGWKDQRTHPNIPGTEQDNPKAKENLEDILGQIAESIRGTGNPETDRQRLKEITHSILTYNGIIS